MHGIIASVMHGIIARCMGSPEDMQELNSADHGLPFLPASVCVCVQQTFELIVAKDPPFRHQTNRLYMPMTAMKHADPTGRLPIDTFYKLVFKHDRVFNAILSMMRMMTKKMGKTGG